ncbi:hypothetical protein JYT31_01040 [Beggiatoa alba]|nr:hypothetical protein [Beggiatoa alba]
MEPLTITYKFKWSSENEYVYSLQLDPDSLEIISPKPDELPDWTRLEFHQCPNCKLNKEESPYCPLAVQLAEINENFNDLVSYEEIQVEVITAERHYSKNTQAQQAISSLMGLIIPCSGCPETRYFRPMARFHLPFSSEQETIYRAASMYLLAQYFTKKSGQVADLELKGLDKIYDAFHEINTCCAGRLRDSSSKDSTVNAVVLLDIFTKTLSYVIEDSLEDIQYLFNSFQDDP